eukprot:scaffold5939_cov165-Ochromonas_danica.AAC.17
MLLLWVLILILQQGSRPAQALLMPRPLPLPATQLTKSLLIAAHHPIQNNNLAIGKSDEYLGLDRPGRFRSTRLRAVGTAGNYHTTLTPGQLIYLHDLHTYGVLRQRTKEGTWIIEVYYSASPEAMAMQSAGFIERDERLLAPLDLPAANTLPIVSSNMDRIDDLKHIMRWIKNNLGMRALGPIASQPQSNRLLGLHRYGLAPRGQPITSDLASDHRQGMADFLIQSLLGQGKQVLAQDSLVNALVTALFRRGRVDEAKEVLRAKQRYDLEHQHQQLLHQQHDDNQGEHHHRQQSQQSLSSPFSQQARFLLRQAEAAHRSGDLSLALAGYEALQSVVTTPEQAAQAAFLTGVVLGDMGRLMEAIPCYQKAIDIMPSHAHAHRNLGIAYSSLGMKQAALACLRKALTLDTERVTNLCNLAALLWQSAQSNYNQQSNLINKKKALQYVLEAQRLQPNDPRPRDLMRWFLSQDGATLLEEVMKMSGNGLPPIPPQGPGSTSTAFGGGRRDEATPLTLGDLIKAFRNRRRSGEDGELETFRKRIESLMKAREEAVKQQQQRYEEDDAISEVKAKLPRRLAEEVVREDHVAEDRRVMTDKQDTLDWLKALEQGWAVQRAQQEDKLSTARQQWANLLQQAHRVDEEQKHNPKSVSVAFDDVRDKSKQPSEEIPDKSRLESWLSSFEPPATNGDASAQRVQIPEVAIPVEEPEKTDVSAEESRRVESAYQTLRQLAQSLYGSSSQAPSRADQEEEERVRDEVTRPASPPPPVESYQQALEDLSSAHRVVQEANEIRDQARIQALRELEKRENTLVQRWKRRNQQRQRATSSTSVSGDETPSNPTVTAKEQEKAVARGNEVGPELRGYQGLTSDDIPSDVSLTEEEGPLNWQNVVEAARDFDMARQQRQWAEYEYQQRLNQQREQNDIFSSILGHDPQRYEAEREESAATVSPPPVSSPEGTADSDSSVAQIPFMVTKNMMKILVEELNYPRRLVNQMTPIQAHFIIQNQIKHKPPPRTVFDEQGNAVRVN